MQILPQITLCSIDTRHPHLALQALSQSMRAIKFGDIVFITTSNIISTYNTPLPPGIRIAIIDTINNIEEYSLFVLTKLSEYIRTPYALVIQWDGYVINPEVWSDEFCNYDYIGAPWLQKDGSKLVGNGGFSLRSQRLLKVFTHENLQLHHPEDDCIAKTNRKLLENHFKIRFAPPAIADMFAFEFTTAKAKTFGFHGFNNFPDVMSDEELYSFITTMPEQLVCSGYFPGFIERLHARQQSISSYAKSMVIVEKIISSMLADGYIPEKSLVKALIRCGMNKLAKTSINLRIKTNGYSETNIHLFARYLGRKFKNHLLNLKH